jgi:ParB family transcriptional regulator, chromosome partitioning protein
MSATAQIQINTVPVALLRHSMVAPRAKYNPQKLARLAESMAKTNGPLEPLLVRPHLENGLEFYEVVRGTRRHRAALQAGFETLPVEIRVMSDSQAKRAALIDALERERLSDLEHIEAVLDLLCYELSLPTDGVKKVMTRMHNSLQKRKSLDHVLDGREGGAALAEQCEKIVQLFDEIGSSWRGFLTNGLPLLELPSDLLDGLRNDTIPNPSIARLLARVSLEARAALVQELSEKTLSTRQLEDKVLGLLGELKPEKNYARTLKAFALRLEKAPEAYNQNHARLMELMSELEELLAS